MIPMRGIWLAAWLVQQVLAVKEGYTCNSYQDVSVHNYFFPAAGHSVPRQST